MIPTDPSVELLDALSRDLLDLLAPQSPADEKADRRGRHRADDAQGGPEGDAEEHAAGRRQQRSRHEHHGEHDVEADEDERSGDAGRRDRVLDPVLAGTADGDGRGRPTDQYNGQDGQSRARRSRDPQKQRGEPP